MSVRQVLVRLIAVVIGATAAVLVVASLPSPSPRPAESAATVRRDFLDRWEAWRRATVAFSEQTTRRAGARELTSTVMIVQRFPDEMVRAGTDVSARLGGRLIGCTVRPGGASTCLDSGGYRPDDELAAEMARWRAAIEGADRTYRLSRTAPTCFRARHVGRDRRPEWGDRFDVCFGAHGVAVRETMTVGTVTSDVRRDHLDTDVTEAMFELPAVPMRSEGSANPGGAPQSDG